MKTIKQIKTHLLACGYNRDARHRIMGFLLGNGTIKKGSVLRFTECPAGEKIHDFEHFYAWFNNDLKPEHELVEFLFEEQLEALSEGNWKRSDRICALANFVVDHFGLDAKEKARTEDLAGNANAK